jgi:transposase
LADAGIRPVALLLSAGQAGDNPRLVPLLDALAQSGHRPAHLLADKAYSHPSTRRELRRRRIRHTIPERSDQVQRRKDQGPGGGRPPKFDAELYKQRNTIETSKPQCCHICGSSDSSRAPSSSELMPAC